MKAILRNGSIGILLVIAFVAGILVRDGTVATAENKSEFPLLVETIDFVNRHFVKEQPSDKEVEYALIRAYLDELDDPNTFFVEPVVAASESDTLAGRYGGIGVEIQRNESGQFVLYPYPDAAAEEAGIRDGDILLSINGESLDLGTQMDVVRQALRGRIEPGNGVSIIVRNIEETDEREYFIEFAEVLVPSVTWRTLFEAPEVGYINIVRFTSRTPEEFREAATALKEEDVIGIVLDVRGNSGGLLAESLTVTGEFFDGGVISIERRVSGEIEKEDEPGGVLLDLPVVVLVDRNTASAAEIVAGAIQARDRGVLIGQQTFGKGSIQSIFGLSDDSSIHVTVALWFTPENEALEGQGLTPDIEMIPDERGRDVELGEAIRYLRREESNEG